MKTLKGLFSPKTLRAALSAALALILCLSAAPITLADSELMPESLPEGFFTVNSLAVMDGRLYCASFDGIYIVSEDGEKIELMYAFADEELQPDVIFVWNGSLCGLHSDSGSVYRYSASGAPSEKLLVLNTTSINRDEGYFMYSEPLYAPFVYGDLLYATTQTEEYGVYITHRWQLTTGEELSPVSMENLYCALPYPDGRLLLILRDLRAYYGDNRTDETASAYLYDESTGALESFAPLDGFEISAFAMDGEKLYFLCDSTVYELAQGETRRAVGYATAMYPDASTAAAVLGGKYYVSGRTQLISRDINRDASEKTTIRVASFNFGSNHTDAEKLTDAVELLVSPQQYSIEDTVEAIRSGSTDADVYLITADADMAKVYGEGVLLPLESEELRSFVLGTSEAVRSCAANEDKVYALPISVYDAGGLCGLRWYPQELNMAGLSESDIPKDLLSFFDFLTEWCENNAPDYPELCIMKVYDKSSFIHRILETYLYSCKAAGTSPDFGGETFRLLMEKGRACLSALNAAGMVYKDTTDEKALEDYWSKAEVFELTEYDAFDFSGGCYSTARYAPLPLSEGMSAVFPITVELLFINPNTAHMKEALEYVSAYRSAMTEETLIRLSPESAQPVLNPNYDEYISDTEKSISELEATIATASKREKPELQSRLDNLREVLENRDYCRYLITPDDLTDYNFALEHSVSAGSFKGFDNAVMTALDGYFNGRITLDALIERLSAASFF